MITPNVSIMAPKSMEPSLKQDQGEASVFKNILLANSTSDLSVDKMSSDIVVNQEDSIREKLLSEDLVNVLKSGDILMEDLFQLLELDEEMQKRVKELVDEIQASNPLLEIEALEELISLLKSLETSEDIRSPEKFFQNLLITNHSSTVVGSSALVPMAQTLDKKEVQSSWEGIQKLLNKMENGSITLREQKQMFLYLQQWSNFQKQNPQAIQTIMSDLQESKVAKVWSSLIENYQSRSSLTEHYGGNKKVTQQDLVNWMKHAIQSYKSQSESNSLKQTSPIISTGPVHSKIQQYIIYTQQTNTDNEMMQKQLLDQFQQIMVKSNFLQRGNGINQLMVRLQPEQLGDITLKLTQVNGEMTVKMIVSSQATKDLLEGNLQQLRHMFSPHQVLIEKQDSSNLLAHSEEMNLAEQYDEENSQDEQNSFSEEHGGENEEATDFHQLLMDAKV